MDNNIKLNNSYHQPRYNIDRIDKVAKEFESVFLSKMLHGMFEGIETNQLIGGGKAENIFRSMMIDEYAKVISDSETLGISQHIKDTIIKTQGVEHD